MPESAAFRNDRAIFELLYGCGTQLRAGGDRTGDIEEPTGNPGQGREEAALCRWKAAAEALAVYREARQKLARMPLGRARGGSY
jgi:hypothetical protein